MDARAAAALCMLDLGRLIDAGDFREYSQAGKIVDDAASSAPTDRDYGAFLYWLSEELATVETPANPESDAFLRAMRANVRLKIEGRFEAHQLTLRAAGA